MYGTIAVREVNRIPRHVFAGLERGFFLVIHSSPGDIRRYRNLRTSVGQVRNVLHMA